jgi:serine kinase of HPr protein (carbohydrate metabolism regulator)
MSWPATVHAGAVLLGETGILIRGVSGSGKSSLILALLDRDRAAHLVADDRVALSVAGGRLLAAAPPELAGLIEIRGQGIVRRPFVSPVVIHLVVDLLPADQCPRLPDPGERVKVEGILLPQLRLPFAMLDETARLALYTRRFRPVRSVIPK